MKPKKTLEDGRKKKCPAFYGRRIAFKGVKGWQRGKLVYFESWGFLGILIVYLDFDGKKQHDFADSFSLIEIKYDESGKPGKGQLVNLNYLYKEGIIREPKGIDFQAKLAKGNAQRIAEQAG